MSQPWAAFRPQQEFFHTIRDIPVIRRKSVELIADADVRENAAFRTNRGEEACGIALQTSSADKGDCIGYQKA